MSCICKIYIVSSYLLDSNENVAQELKLDDFFPVNRLLRIKAKVPLLTLIANHLPALKNPQVASSTAKPMFCN